MAHKLQGARRYLWVGLVLFTSQHNSKDLDNSGGAEQFIAGSGSPNGTDYYKAFQAKGYKVVYNKQQLLSAGNNDKTLGIFSGM